LAPPPPRVDQRRPPRPARGTRRGTLGGWDSSDGVGLEPHPRRALVGSDPVSPGQCGVLAGGELCRVAHVLS